MKPIVGTNMQVRQINSDTVLSLLRRREHASVAELAKETELSVATCATVIAELVKEGCAIELDERVTEGGRPARRFRYNPDHSLLAIMLFKVIGGRGGMSCKVVNAAGDIKEEKEETRNDLSICDVDAMLKFFLGKYLSVKIVVLSIPGVTKNGFIQTCDIPALAEMDIEEHVSLMFGTKTIAENDMNLAAMGYCARHPGAAEYGLAYVNFPVDKCIGAGMVLNGWLVRGKSNFAGELGCLPESGRGAKGRGRTVADICQALIAVINPGTIVLSGELVDEGMLAGIAARLSGVVSKEHLPTIEIKEGFDDDCFAGALAMGIGTTSSNIRMVAKEREWCVDV